MKKVARAATGEGGARGQSKTTLLISAVLVVAPLLVLSPLFTAEFTNWDDESTVTKNQAMFAPMGQAIAGFWVDWRKPEGSLYIPLTRTVWRVLAEISRKDAATPGAPFHAWIFHGASLCIHVIATLVAFALLRRLVRIDWAAGAGALLYALHPLQVESVAWVSGLKDVLSGMFSLVALYGFLRSLRQTTDALPSKPGTSTSPDTSRINWLWYAIGTAGFLLAMLSKPSAVVVPVLAVVVGLAVHFRTAEKVRRAMPWRAVLLTVLPWVLLSMPFVLITAVGQPAEKVERSPLILRPLIATDALAFYTTKLVAPTGLAVDLGRTPQYVRSTRELYWTWAVPVVCAVAALLCFRRMPTLTFGLAFFFLAPLSLCLV
jgi:protein O-mannosyl-transferase